MASQSSTHLYRILSFRHVVSLFESRELYFAPPGAWDDPYEKVLVHKRSHTFFAQCWCKKAVSDAMWRIYSPDRASLRIRTSRSKLSRALKCANEAGNFGYLVNDVEYLRSSDVDARISQIAKDLRATYDSRRAADALLVKRDAFDHEAEVRVIVHDKIAEDDSKPKPALRVPIDPHLLVESIFFDPRADEAFVRMCTYYLQEAVKFKRQIATSALYKIRDPVVVE